MIVLAIYIKNTRINFLPSFKIEGATAKLYFQCAIAPSVMLMSKIFT